jgi:hypothetical protein
MLDPHNVAHRSRAAACDRRPARARGHYDRGVQRVRLQGEDPVGAGRALTASIKEQK